jgi:uncharacterized repeat protein (TIGR01451 family)
VTAKLSYDEYRNISKEQKISAIKTLEKQRNKSSLHILCDFALKDQDKDVRKSAIDSIVVLNDPEAVSVLQRIQRDDKDRGARNKAKDGANRIQQFGKPLGESEFSEEDEERAAGDYRALEESEKGQAGLYVKIQESLQYRIDRDNNLVDEEGEEISGLVGTGKLEIVNTGSKDRIWAIDAILEGVDEVIFNADEAQGTAVFGNSFALKELDPKSSKYVPFEYQVEAPKLSVQEDFWDLEKEDSPPLFARGEESGMKFTIKLTNEFDDALNDVVVKKYILDDSTTVGGFEASIGSLKQSSDDEGSHVLWEIEEIEAGDTVEASCVMKVTLPEEGNDPYIIGDTKTTYKVKEKSLSGLGLDTITGSSSVFQFISREEQEENPGDFDCLFELENTSEFEMDLKEVKIFEGPLDEGNVRIEWLGTDFPEEERSIDPGETFSLDPWTITVEDDNMIPQFGRELDLSVKYLFDAEVVAECVLSGYALPFMGIEVTKTYEPLVIPSFRRTEVFSEQVVKSIGSTEIMYIQLSEAIPEGFEGPEREQIEILKASEQLEDFDFDLSGSNVVITMEHLEDSEFGPLAQDEEILVKYPLYATAKPEEEFTGIVTVLGNIYPEVKPISAEAEAGPITVVHERRKLKIGKMVSSTSSEETNEYEVVLRGVNDGTAVIQNVEITDFLPNGFELVGETHEDPEVGFEEHSSVNNGQAMKWIFEEVQPEQKVEIRFKIRAPGEHDPAEVYRMLVG